MTQWDGAKPRLRWGDNGGVWTAGERVFALAQLRQPCCARIQSHGSATRAPEPFGGKLVLAPSEQE